MLSQHKITRRPVPGEGGQQFEAEPWLVTPIEGYGSSRAPKEEARVTSTSWPGVPDGAAEERITNPRQLGEKSFFSKYFTPGFDLLLALLPLVFILIGGLAKSLDQKAVVSHVWGLNLITATRYGVTIYPILFAAIAGNFFQSAAGWLLERGTTLMVLEQLLGSTALFGTIKTQIMLNNWNLKAVIILLLWSLSPLGGQGTLRLISLSSREVHNISPIWYQITNSTVETMWPSTYGSQIDVVNSIFTSSLIATNETQDGPQDTWGNVKIPRIESLRGGESLASGTWYPVPEANLSFSSLVGIPIQGVPRDANSTFVIQASYFNLKCPDGPRFIKRDDEVVWSAQNDTDTKGKVGGYIRGSKKSVAGRGSDRYGKSGSRSSTWSLGSFGPFPSSVATEPLSLYLQSDTEWQNGNNPGISTLKCSMTHTHVDCQIECVGKICRVSAMTLSPGTAFPDLNIPRFSVRCQQVFNNIVVATGYYHDFTKFTTNSLTEQYLKYGSSPLAYEDRTYNLNLSLVSQADLEERFTQVINSYWLPSIDPYNMVGDDHDLDVQAREQQEALFQGARTTQKVSAEITAMEDIYVCHTPWLIFLLVSSLAMFLCAVASFAFKSLTVGPEIVGRFSTVTRDNPYIRVPEGGSVLDGYARTKVLKDLRVRVGDVRGSEDVGHISITSLDDDSFVHLQKGRFYD